MSDPSYWTRRTSRRRLLAGAGATLAGAALAACSGSSSASKSAAGDTAGAHATAAAQSISTPTRVQTPLATADATKINKNGVYNIRQPNPYASLNPYKGLDSGLAWGTTVFDHLWFSRNDTGEIVHFLGDTFEQPDPLHFTWTIKPAFFHDKPPANGRQVKAADVAASFNAGKKAPQTVADVWWRTTFNGATPVDDKTIAFTQNNPDAWTFSTNNGGSPITSSILPQEIAANINAMDNDLIGSGRFQFVSQENGTNFKLKRFDNWRVKGEPWLAGINFKLLQQQAGAVAAFTAGQIDSIGFQTKQERDQIAQQMGNKITTFTEPTAVNWMLVFKGNGQWADPRARQAIYQAIDRDEFIQLMYFGDATKTGPVPLIFKNYALPASELQSTLWNFDPQSARQLLQAAGVDTSKTYQFPYNGASDQQNNMAQITQGQLQKNLGIKTNLVSQDLATWLGQTVVQGTYDFTTYPTLNNPDPSSYANVVLKSNGVQPNATGFLDDELDADQKQQQLTLDEPTRIGIIQDLQRKWIAKFGPWLPVISPLSSTAIWNYLHLGDLGNGGLMAYSGQTYEDPH